MKKCRTCDSLCESVCSECRVNYCSMWCLVKDWNIHRFTCGKPYTCFCCQQSQLQDPWQRPKTSLTRQGYICGTCRITMDNVSTIDIPCHLCKEVHTEFSLNLDGKLVLPCNKCCYCYKEFRDGGAGILKYNMGKSDLHHEYYGYCNEECWRNKILYDNSKCTFNLNGFLGYPEPIYGVLVRREPGIIPTCWKKKKKKTGVRIHWISSTISNST
jgi:hypothetical protein